MSTVATTSKMKFYSRPSQRRIALVPMSFMMVFAWVLLAVDFGAAIFAVRHFDFLGALMLLAVFGLAVYLVLLTRRWVKSGSLKHELTIDGKNVRLNTFDPATQKSTNREMSLKDVIEAEYYEPKDTSILLLRSRSRIMDIPLWSFGPAAERKIVDYVQSCGIKIVGIPVPYAELR